MSFVHGHARDTGWVVAHRRAPHRSEAGQLALLPGRCAAESARARGSPDGAEQRTVAGAPPDRRRPGGAEGDRPA